MHWGVYEVEREAGQIVALHPFAADPDPSPIGASVPGALTSPTRVRRPAVRRSILDGGPGRATQRRGQEPFVEVGWDEALDLVAGAIDGVREAHGNASIFAGSYGWSSAGRFHHAQSQIHRFMNAAGGYTGHVGTYSLGAARALLPHIVMPMDDVISQMTAWPVLEAHCQLFIAFGGIPARNAQVGSGGAAHHWLRSGLARLVARGCRIINISPAGSDVDGVASEWIPVRPNSDVALMLGLAFELHRLGLLNREFLARYCSGFNRFEDYLLGCSDGVPKTAAWAAALTGVPGGRITQLAREIGCARTMLNASWSLQRAEHGEQPYWMLITLAAMVGQIGLPGGGFGLGYGAINNAGAAGYPFSGPTLPQGENPVRTHIPVARIADMLLNAGGQLEFNGTTLTYPDIRLIYWAGGNPFHHHQDLNRLRCAWQKPELIVVNEQYWTATAKFADVVLPATTSLERDDIGSSNRDRHIVAMKRAIEPVGEARDDYEIFMALARRLGCEAAYTEGRDTSQWLRHLYALSARRAMDFGVRLPDFDVFWARGHFELPLPAQPAVLLERFRRDPEQFRLPTPSGRLEIFSLVIDGFGYADCPGHPVWIEPQEWLGRCSADESWLHMLSSQPASRLHSQYDHGAVSVASKVQGREPIGMNPADAAARGIRDQDIVRVYNARGSCLAGARLDPDLMPGVVRVATGAWYDPLETGAATGLAAVARLEVHGNPNVLTPDTGTSRLAQGCSAQSTLVKVERYLGALPPVRAFEPPVLCGRCVDG